MKVANPLFLQLGVGWLPILIQLQWKLVNTHWFTWDIAAPIHTATIWHDCRTIYDIIQSQTYLHMYTAVLVVKITVTVRINICIHHVNINKRRVAAVRCYQSDVVVLLWANDHVWWSLLICISMQETSYLALVFIIALISCIPSFKEINAN